MAGTTSDMGRRDGDHVTGVGPTIVVAETVWELSRFYEESVQLVRIELGAQFPPRELERLRQHEFRGLARIDTGEGRPLGVDDLATLLPYWIQRDQASAVLGGLAAIVDVFASLVDAKEVGARLLVPDAPPCPAFHVDRVEARAVCTLVGPGTEWTTDAHVGCLARGSPRHESPDRVAHPVVHRLKSGELAVFKGTGWPGNGARGLAHRSPGALSERRVVLTLDLLA